MSAQLIALDYGPNILLDKPILLLGRHLECDIQIDSPKISRRHCCIAQVSDYLVVRDLGSTNGIRINGKRVTEGRLNAGDELTIGNYRYKVTWEAVSATAAPLAPVSPSPSRGKGTKANEAPRKPSLLAHIEDEMLESCDEPVPLDEPGVNVAPDVLPGQAPAPKSPTPVKGKGRPLQLPDDLGLMPNSEHFRKDSPLASPSGSHSPV
jgi:pSer/pThr/pTyr-binding forkhead associated (FHA) protein